MGAFGGANATEKEKEGGWGAGQRPKRGESGAARDAHPSPAEHTRARARRNARLDLARALEVLEGLPARGEELPLVVGELGVGKVEAVEVVDDDRVELVHPQALQAVLVSVDGRHDP